MRSFVLSENRLLLFDNVDLFFFVEEISMGNFRILKLGSAVIAAALLAIFCLSDFSPFGATAYAAGMYDPKLDWKTVETEHFYVHYHTGLEHTAMETASDAERAYGQLTSRFDHTPRAKIHLVVTDVDDSSNGMSSVFPYPQVSIYSTAPSSDSSLDNYDYWLPTLLTHELTHVVVIDMTRGIPAALRFLFGYSIAFNAFVPGWLTEGASVNEETSLTTAGRGRGAYMDMALRCAIIEGKFPSIDRAGNGMIDWPGGQSPYIFGGAFYMYLVEKYGEKKMAEFFDRYSGQLIPFRINAAAEKTLGKDFVALWDEWQKAINEKYKADAEKIKAEGIVSGQAITNRGYYIERPLWAADSGKIYFSEYSPHTGGAVRSIASDGKGEKKILGVGAGSGMALDPSGERLVYSKLIPYSGKPSKRFYFFNDLYIYNLKTGKSSRLTKGERASDPSFSPDGKRVVYVSRSNAGTALKYVEIDSGKIAEIIAAKTSVAIDTPRYSPDGSALVFSAHTAGAGRDIFLLKNGEANPAGLTDHPSRDLDPVWSADGKYILFTGERTGIANIFAIDAAAGNLFQVTNVLGGAYQASVSPDGKWIAYSGYTSRGYDVFRLDYNPLSWRPAVSAITATVAEPISSPEIEIAATIKTSKPKKYFPFGMLLPKYLIPVFWYDGFEYSFGLQTGGQDAIVRHAWMADASWGSGSEFLSWGASYAYRRFMPTVGIGGGQNAVSYGEILYSLDKVGKDLYAIATLDEDYYEQRSHAFLWAEETFGIYNRPVTFYLSYRWEDRDSWTEIPDLVFDSMLPGRGTFSGVEFIVSYDAATTYSYSISPEKGFKVTLGFERLDESLGSDYNQTIFTGDFRAFVPMPGPFRHHVLALRAAGGIMDGDQLYQGTFRVGGSVGESMLSSPGRKFFILRGYDVAQYIGDSAAVVSGEYRFPLGYPQRGFKRFPLFFQKAHAAIFADYGGAFDRKNEYPLSIGGAPLVDANTGDQLVMRFEEEDSWHLGMGAELRLTGFLGYGMMPAPITGRFGFAKDVSGDGLGNTVFFELGTSY